MAFTGSTDTAARIQTALAEKSTRPIVPFIAETGGQNVMIADSSALIEQTTDDVIRSAFLSAGQRCSALRVLCVQHEVADTLLESIRGGGRRTDDRRPADPPPTSGRHRTTVAERIEAHIERMRALAATCGTGGGRRVTGRAVHHPHIIASTPARFRRCFAPHAVLRSARELAGLGTRQPARIRADPGVRPHRRPRTNHRARTCGKNICNPTWRACVGRATLRPGYGLSAAAKAGGPHYCTVSPSRRHHRDTEAMGGTSNCCARSAPDPGFCQRAQLPDADPKNAV